MVARLRSAAHSRTGQFVERVESRMLLSAALPHAHGAAVAVAHARVVHTVKVKASAAAVARSKASIAAAVASVPAGLRATPDSFAAPVAGRAAARPAASTLSPDAGQNTPGPGITPIQMRTAYGLGGIETSPVTFNGVQADGRGETIAIVDAYGDPYAANDINTFSSAFSLPLMNQPGGPTFTQLDQNGGTNLPGNSGDWTGEISLDIEWAHTIAPMANIVLFEANSASDSDLYTAVTTAADSAGVVAVSQSYGSGEYSDESNTDPIFTTPAGHPGVTFLASTGDTGGEVEYPSVSPNVVAVGGTSLSLNGDNSYAGEIGWNHSGGNVSAYESRPAYQSGITTAFTATSATQRLVPDVSMDAGRGVPICDSYDFGASTPWLGGGYAEEGTSLACPLFAGLIAITDQGRAAEGLGYLDGPSQTLPRLYQLRASDYHDVTSINNGTPNPNNGVGYDLNTGIGSPVANQLVPDLAGGATITGRLFQDNNANGVFDGSDTPLTGYTVYLDLNNSGVQTANDPTATVVQSGTYTFTSGGGQSDLIGGLTAPVRTVGTLPGYVQVPTAAVPTAYNTTTTANDAYFRTSYTDANGGDTYTIRAATTSSPQLQILVNGTLTYSAPVSLPPSLSFGFTGAHDTANVDFGGGSPVPAGGLSVSGSAASNGDALNILGSNGNDSITVNSGTVLFGSNTITYSNMPNLSVDPRGGTDALAVNAGAVAIPAQVAGGGFLARTFSSLSVAAGAKLAVGTAAARADRSVLVVTTPANLSIAATGQLDLGGNDLIAQGGNLPTLAGLVAAGYAGGAWTGLGGLASSAAAANPAHVTALGVIQNAANGSPVFSTFDGQPVATTDVLVKYTYYGDANLDGVVNGADYSRTDAGFIAGLTGWANGDYNYDGTVDGTDYTLIDNAFNTQAGAL